MGDATSMPIIDGGVDMVICKAVTHHLSDSMLCQALDESRRVLRLGGHMILFDAILNPQSAWPDAYCGHSIEGLIHAPKMNSAATSVTDSKSYVGKNLSFITNTFLESASALKIPTTSRI